MERSSALFFLTSAVNVAALVGAGTLVAVGVASGPNDILRAGIPILGGVGATAAVLAAPSIARRRPQRRRPGWLLDLCAGIDAALDDYRPARTPPCMIVDAADGTASAISGRTSPCVTVVGASC